MPVPIGLVNGKPNRPESKGLLDISFLAQHIPTKEASNISITLSDKDAEALMKIWLNAKKVDNDTFVVEESVGLKNKDLLRLKSRGLISGGTEKVKFTSKGRTVISTMALGESNNFLKNKKEKSYTEILASMNKKGKKGYRIASVYDENSHLLNMAALEPIDDEFLGAIDNIAKEMYPDKDDMDIENMVNAVLKFQPKSKWEAIKLLQTLA